MKLFLLILSTLCIEEVYNRKLSLFDLKRDEYLEKSYGLGADTSNGSKRWFKQNLDHFNPADKRTWLQLYFVNDKFFNKSRNVAFLSIGLEGALSHSSVKRGSWIEYAKHFQAICFSLEHRFYGDSHPTKDLSLQNLQYLSSQQAVADSAFFIKSMNMKYNLSSDVKWVAFGSSYAASLAAWLRQSYPYLVHGAVSSSAPLLAKLNYEGYFKNVADVLRSHSNECVTAVMSGTNQAELLLQNKVGQEKFEKLFKLCDPIVDSLNKPNDISNLFAILATYFGRAVQSNNVCPGDSNVTIDALCKIMTNRTIGQEVNRLAAVNDFFFKEYNYNCIGYKFKDLTDSLKETSWNSSGAYGDRQWYFQSCTEFGFFQTTDYKPQVFGDKCTIDYNVRKCEVGYGPEFNYTFLQNAIYRTNTLHGGLHINVSNVVFVQGSFDPWKSLGITKTLGKSSPAILIEGSSHMADTCPPSKKDSPALKAARVKIQNFIGSWLNLE